MEEKNRYKVTETVYNGVELVGYKVIDCKDNKKLTLRYEDVARMCREQRISNAKVVLFNGVYRVIVKEDVKIADRGKENLSLIRITNEGGQKCAYIKDSNKERSIRVNCRELWGMTKSGRVNHVRAVVIKEGDKIKKGVVIRADSVNETNNILQSVIRETK